MRCFLSSLTAASLLLLPACRVQSSHPESEMAPVPPEPAARDAAAEEVEQSESAARELASTPQFTLDPAPAPPINAEPVPAPELEADNASAEEVFQSVARVLRGAIAGGSDEGSNESVFGSVGRALSKGFQEAAGGESAADE